MKRGRLVTIRLLLKEDDEALVSDEIAETLRSWEANPHGNATLVDWGYIPGNAPDDERTLVDIPDDYQEGDLLNFGLANSWSVDRYDG